MKTQRSQSLNEIRLRSNFDHGMDGFYQGKRIAQILANGNIRLENQINDFYPDWEQVKIP